MSARPRQAQQEAASSTSSSPASAPATHFLLCASATMGGQIGRKDEKKANPFVLFLDLTLLNLHLFTLYLPLVHCLSCVCHCQATLKSLLLLEGELCSTVSQSSSLVHHCCQMHELLHHPHPGITEPSTKPSQLTYLAQTLVFWVSELN